VSNPHFFNLIEFFFDKFVCVLNIAKSAGYSNGGTRNAFLVYCLTKFVCCVSAFGRDFCCTKRQNSERLCNVNVLISMFFDRDIEMSPKIKK